MSRTDRSKILKNFVFHNSTSLHKYRKLCIHSKNIWQSLFWAALQEAFVGGVWCGVCIVQSAHICSDLRLQKISHDAIDSNYRRHLNSLHILFWINLGSLCTQKTLALVNFYSCHVQLHNPRWGHNPQLKTLWVHWDVQSSSAFSLCSHIT